MTRWSALTALPLLAACWGSNAHIMQGEVVEVSSPTQVVIQHDDIPGLMPAMTMPFTVRDPALLADLSPGDQVYARLIADDDAGWYLAQVKRKPGTQRANPSESEAPTLPAPLRPGQTLPSTQVPLSSGQTITIGDGAGPTLLTFLYTTCPQPEFCPAIAARLQGVQAALEPGQARILAVTIDPGGDTPEVLESYAKNVGAKPEIWQFGRLDEPELHRLAARAALTIDTASGSTEILHSIRVLVLDKDGALVERYDDARFPADRVLEQLRTGGPPAPPDGDGTLTPPADDAKEP